MLPKSWLFTFSLDSVIYFIIVIITLLQLTRVHFCYMQPNNPDTPIFVGGPVAYQ